jgi:16S rRNA processing protein RimM
MGQNGSSATRLVIVGSIGAPSGVKGWLKINSYTEPTDNIVNFKQWFLVDSGYDDCTDNQDIVPLPVNVLSVKNCHDINRFLVLIAGVADRNAASLLTNKKIAVERQQLPELSNGQYYWTDLIGCTVVNRVDESLGQVKNIFNNSANDILVIQGDSSGYEHLVPFIMDEFVLNVDLANQKILVNWERSN